MIKRAEEHVWWLIEAEDENTDFANLGPVNGPMNTLVAYIREGRDCHAVREHLKTLRALTSLSLGSHNRIGEEGCEHLKELRALTHLSIEGDNRISAEGCKHLKALHCLIKFR